MAVLSRLLRRRNLIRSAAGHVALAWLAVLGAFVYAAVTVQPALSAVVAALAALAIAGAGILYAWREPGR
jgi:predicted Kef-type K+ transport protein